MQRQRTPGAAAGLLRRASGALPLRIARRHRHSPSATRFINPLRVGVAAPGPPKPAFLDHISMRHGMLAAERELRRHAMAAVALRESGAGRAPPLSARDVDPAETDPAHRLPRSLPIKNAPRSLRKRRAPRASERDMPARTQAWFPGLVRLVERPADDKQEMMIYFKRAPLVGVEVEHPLQLNAGACPLPTSLVTLAVDQCAAMYPLRQLGGLPFRAAEVLGDPRVVKVVWDAGRVIPRLTAELGVHVRSVVDVREAARRCGLPDGDTRDLALRLLRLHVPQQGKPAAWDAWPLTEGLVQCAARNAWLLRELLFALPDGAAEVAVVDAEAHPAADRLGLGPVATPAYRRRREPHLVVPALRWAPPARPAPMPVDEGVARARREVRARAAASAEDLAARWSSLLETVLERSVRAAAQAGVRMSVVADAGAAGPGPHAGAERGRAGVEEAMARIVRHWARPPVRPRLQDARRVLRALGGDRVASQVYSHGAVPALHPPWLQVTPHREQQWVQPTAETGSRLGSSTRAGCEVRGFGLVVQVWGAPGPHVATHCAYGLLLLRLLQAEGAGGAAA